MPYKYFGLWAVIVLIIGLVFVVWRWPGGKHMTFSQHVARQRISILYYILLFSIVLPLLLLFFTKWFTPAAGVSPWLNYFIVGSALFQFACTLVPETGGRQSQWHRLLAGISAICLIPPLIMLLFTTTITVASKVVVAMGLLTMLGCIYLLARGRGEHNSFLILQSAYFAAFLAPVMYISYVQLA